MRQVNQEEEMEVVFVFESFVKKTIKTTVMKREVHTMGTLLSNND